MADLITVPAAAALAGCDPKTIANRIAAGDLRAVRAGPRATLVYRGEVLRLKLSAAGRPRKRGKR